MNRLNECIASFAGGVKIPASLSERLDLQSLKWHTLSTNLCRLIIGKPLKGNDITNIDDAVATIEISRTMDSEQNKPVSYRLRIAGIDKNQGIVAATWDMIEDNRIVELSISIPINESLEILKTLDFNNATAEKLVTSAITKFDKPYEAAGLITKAMHKLNNSNIKEDPNGTCFHDRVLTFRFEGDNSENADSMLLLEKCGYYFKNENGVLEVGLGSEEANSKNLKPWKFSVPAFLEKLAD